METYRGNIQFEKMAHRLSKELDKEHKKLLPSLKVNNSPATDDEGYFHEDDFYECFMILLDDKVIGCVALSELDTYKNTAWLSTLYIILFDVTKKESNIA